jgi:hypothetical protein
MNFPKTTNGAVAIATPPRIVPRDPNNPSAGFYVYPSTRLPVTLADIENLQMPDYLGMKGKIVNAVDHRRFDTNVVMAATDLAKGEYFYFDKKKNSTDRKTLDGGTTIAILDQTYTNMLDANRIEESWSLIVDSLQVDLIQSHRDFSGFTSNTGEPSTGAPSATDTNSATTQFLALTRNVNVKFETIDNVEKEIFAEGRIDDFPSDRSVCGAFGGATPEGFIGNFNYDGQPEYLRSPVVLQSQHLFQVVLQALRTVTCPLNAEIGIALSGLLVKTGR